jgi:hypothetical protein
VPIILGYLPFDSFSDRPMTSTLNRPGFAGG